MKSVSARAPRRTAVPVHANPRQVLETGRDMARAYAKHLNHDAAITLGRSVCFLAAQTWWSSLTSEGGPQLRSFIQPVMLSPLAEPLEALARSMGEAAAKLAPDEASYHIGLVYTSMLPQEFRTKHGVYYTPPPLAERLLDQATIAGLDWKRCHVLDPACGGGAFLAPVAKRMIAAQPNLDRPQLLRAIGTRLKGFELDPFAAWLSQVGVDAVVLPLLRRITDELPQVVTICNTLTATKPTKKFDLVIGNPPYGRIKLDQAQRIEFAQVLYGHANLYALFMDIALRHTKSGGLLGYLTPTSFLAGEYFKKLRGHLFAQARPVTLDLVAVRKGVFEEVLQEVLLATYKRGSKRKTAIVHLAEPKSPSELKITETASFRLPTNACEPWLMPRSPSEVNVFKHLQRLSSRLENWGYAVSTGPLVWNRHKSQLTDRSGENSLPLIWAEAVTPDGRFIWRANKKNHTRYFRIKDGDDWLIARRPCVVLQRTTAKEQARRLIAAAIPSSFIEQHSAAVIENHLNMLRPISKKPAVGPETLAAFLNSEAADQIFRCISGSVAVSAYELEAMPLPAANELNRLSKLVNAGGSKADIEAECRFLVFGDAHL